VENNLLTRVATILLVSFWPIVAGLIGFAIAGIADTCGNNWALVAIICAAIGSITFALQADLAGTP
jgi:threonine/homoserine efflux transporter RhtA